MAAVWRLPPNRNLRLRLHFGMVMPAMKPSRLLQPLFLAFVLLFAEQAGAAHVLRHTFEDLTHQQQDKQAPHSDACEKCANYAHLGSALNVVAFEFTPPRVSDETAQHHHASFRSFHVLAAVARGPPALLRYFA
jgi:hypothetical protein